jgi:hypothetical protein
VYADYDNFKNTEGQKNAINEVGQKVNAERKKRINIYHHRMQDNTII